MYSKDIILRMIEMMMEFVARMLGLIKKGDFDQASHYIENAYLEFLKEDASFFREIKKENLLAELINKKEFGIAHFEMLSELFYVEAELHLAEGKQSKSINFCEKSILLLDYAIKSSTTKSFEKEARLAVYEKRLEQLLSITS